MKKYLTWNRATFALAIVGLVLLVEIIGYVVMTSLGIVVPAEYNSLMLTTLTGLLAVAGAQYVNGKIARSQ